MNNIQTSQTPEQNDRILAALAHATALLPTFGVIAPIVIWTTQKDKSPYVAYQALQAVVYQFLMIILYFIGMFCYALSIPIMIVVSEIGSSLLTEEVAIIPVMFILLVIFGGGGLFIIYGIIAAVMTFMGKDFRYLLIGKWLSKYINK